MYCTSITLILVVGLVVGLLVVLYEIGGWNVDENGNLMVPMAPNQLRGMYIESIVILKSEVPENPHKVLTSIPIRLLKF